MIARLNQQNQMDKLRASFSRDWGERRLAHALAPCSLGFDYKGGISIDRMHVDFKNDGGLFDKGHVIGIGLAHFPETGSMKCFATWNGQLMGREGKGINILN
jgi:hypothetical protein